MGCWAYQKRDCGTVGCAIGHSADALGIKVDVYGPVYEGETWYHAVAKCLDIKVKKAEWIFDGCQYPVGRITQQMVIDRIEEFINDRSNNQKPVSVD